jgi:hypothetical protein
VCVKGSERNGTTEVSLFALGHNLVVVVQVLLCQPEIDYEYPAVFFTENEVGRLDVTMDKASVVDFLNGDEHLQQDVDGDLEAVSLFKTTPGPR